MEFIGGIAGPLPIPDLNIAVLYEKYMLLAPSRCPRSLSHHQPRIAPSGLFLAYVARSQIRVAMEDRLTASPWARDERLTLATPRGSWLE